MNERIQLNNNKFNNINLILPRGDEQTDKFKFALLHGEHGAISIPHRHRVVSNTKRDKANDRGTQSRTANTKTTI